MTKVYYDNDANLKYLENKKIAVIGYGIQGRAQALNLKDSKMDVIIGLRKNGESFKIAKDEGFEVFTIKEAAQIGDIVHILIPDHLQAKVYKEEIEEGMKEGKALGFSHGFNIHFGQIIPPKYVDVFMVAPKSPGALLRKLFESGGGVPSLIAVQQDFTGKAKEIALAFAKAIGSTKAGVIETTFAEETETDLFGEQAVLCGGITELIRAGFDTLVEAGYQPEVAYFECLHELKLIMDLIFKEGISGMREKVSDTAQYGDLTRGKRIINWETKAEMKRILNEIRSGEFAREWIVENQTNRPVFNALNQKDKNHLIEKIGQKLRKMMPWIMNL